MELIPYECITIKTTLCKDEILQRLEINVATSRFFSIWSREPKPYQGEIDGSHFEITRIIHYMNSFLPIIKGEIKSEMGGSSILITMYPNVLAIAIMGLWLVGTGCMFLVFFINFLFSAILTGALKPSMPDTLLIPAGLFVFGYLAFLGGFKLESVNSKYFFRKLFLADQVEEFKIINFFKAA
jgi:hypothetical protein